MNRELVIELCGPEKEKEGQISLFRHNICGESVGGYPAASQGAILCDRFHVKSFGDRTIFAVADGCNWGLRPRTAATRACQGFMEYLSDPKIQSETTTLNSLKEHILRAFRIAHAKIVGDIPIEEIWTISQTTLIAGMIIPLINDLNSNFGILFYSIGDCKLYLFNEMTGARDLTYGNRANARNAKDTGGRIGPYVDGGQPDLRNLKSFFWPLKSGDSIFVVSDGVYDNLDPESLGNTPAQLKHSNYTDWESMSPDLVIKIKNEFTIQLMNEIFYNCKQRTPFYLSRALVRNSMNITSKSRNFMEANPNSPEPADHIEFPGKMDHVTCLAMSAGAMIQDESKLTSKEKKKQLKDAKTKSAVLKKQAKAHPTEIMYPIKKSIRKSFPKHTFWKAKAGSTLPQEVLPYPPMSLRSGPCGTLVKTSSLVAAGLSFNTIEDEKDTLSEYFLIDTTPRFLLAALSSTCHYGKSSDIPTKVTETFIQYLIKNIETTKDTIEIADMLADALELSHKTLIVNPVFLSENALLIGSVCFRHSEELTTKVGKAWSALVVSIGNCRAFYWDHSKLQLTEITTENLNYDTGCLGPSSEFDDKPILSNLNFYSHFCDSTGVILFLSPGASKIFDPYIFGEKKDSHNLSMEDIEETTKQCRLDALTEILKKTKQADVGDQISSLQKYISKKVAKMEKYEKPEGEKSHVSVLGFRVGISPEDIPIENGKQARIESPRIIQKPISGSPRSARDNISKTLPMSLANSTTNSTDSQREKKENESQSLENSEGGSRKKRTLSRKQSIDSQEGKIKSPKK